MESIIKQMAMIKCCPFCGNTESIKMEMLESGMIPIFYINCSPPDGGCGATGPICCRMDAAIEAWNNRKGEGGMI